MGNLREVPAASLTKPSPAELLAKLTPRQREVLAMLCEGLPNKLIARRLNISDGTVKVHVVHVLRALKVSSRLQAVVVARSLGVDTYTVNAAVPQRPASVAFRVASAPLAQPAAVRVQQSAGVPPPVIGAPSRILPAAPRAKVAPSDDLPLLLGVMAKRLDTIAA